jgi:hypothetical protein
LENYLFVSKRAKDQIIYNNTNYLAKSFGKLGKNRKWIVCQFPKLYPIIVFNFKYIYDKDRVLLGLCNQSCEVFMYTADVNFDNESNKLKFEIELDLFHISYKFLANQ